MSIETQSNVAYFSGTSKMLNDESRTVVLHKTNHLDTFGLYVGEDVPYGLYVVTVDPESPAARANIKPGDRVLSINGELIANIKENPKKFLVNIAAQAQSITLTIQPTDLFEKLDIPFKNSSIQEQPSSSLFLPPGPTLKPPIDLFKHAMGPVKNENRLNADLERYIKSLFVGEDIEILPRNGSTGNHNEFILSKKGDHLTGPIYESLPDDYDHNDIHSGKHRRSKRQLMKNIETQTSFISLPSIGKRPIQPSASSKLNKTSSSPKPQGPPALPASRSSSILSNGQLREPFTSSKPIIPQTITKRSETNISTLTDIDNEIQASKQARPLQKLTSDTTVTEVTSKSTGLPEKGRLPFVSDLEKKEEQKDQRLIKKDDEIQPIEQQKPIPSTTEVANTPMANKRQLEPQARIAPTQMTPISRTGANASENTTNRIAPPNYQDQSFDLISKVCGSDVRHVHLERQQDFEGYGFSVQYNKLYYLIKNIENGSPAMRGDLRINDVIHYINNQTTESMPHSTFVQNVNNNDLLSLIVQNFEAYKKAYPRSTPSIGSTTNGFSQTATTPIPREETKPMSAMQRILARLKRR